MAGYGGEVIARRSRRQYPTTASLVAHHLLDHSLKALEAHGLDKVRGESGTAHAQPVRLKPF